MMTCGVCKQSKETKNRWVITEHTVDNAVMRDFKVCDECATTLIRKIITEMKKEKDEPVEDTIILDRSGLVYSLALAQDNLLEITLSMDLAKARKVVLGETEEKKD